MSLRVALAALEDHGMKVATVIRAMRELVEPDTIEGEVVGRSSKRLTNGNGHQPRQLTTRAGARAASVFPERWCASPECINNHTKGVRGATMFTPRSGRQKFCAKDCMRFTHNGVLRRKLVKRDAKRAKAGLPKVLVGRPRKALEPVTTKRVPSPGHVYKRVPCKDCHKTFMQDAGHKTQCRKCEKERRTRNVAKGTLAMKQRRIAEQAIRDARKAQRKAPEASQPLTGASSEAPQAEA